MENEFNQLILEVPDNVKASLERLCTSFQKASENESKLVAKVKELSDEIASNAGKVSQALKLIDEDSVTILELKKQVTSTWALVEAANTREAESGAALEQLRTDQEALLRLMRKQQSLLGVDNTVEGIILERNLLGTKLREAETLLLTERAKSASLVAEIESSQETCKQQKEQAHDAHRQVLAMRAEEERDRRKVANLEADVLRLRSELETKDGILALTAKQSGDTLMRAADLENKLNAMQSNVVKHATEAERLQLQLMKQQKRLEEEVDAKQRAEDRATTLARELQQKLEEIERQRKMVVQLDAAKAGEIRDRQRITAEKDEATFEVSKLKAHLVGLQKELEAQADHIRSRDGLCGRLDRERNNAEKKAAIAASRAGEVTAVVEEKVAEIGALENDNRRFVLELIKLKNVISVLERERERLKAQLEASQLEVKDGAAEVAARERTIEELESKEEEGAARIKQAQAMYESMRAEKNGVAKALIETHESNSELSRKSRVQSNQLETMKEDLHAKDRALIAEQFEHRAVEKRLDQRGHEVEALRRLVEEANANVNKQDAQVAELGVTVRALEAEAAVAKRAFDRVVTERDLLCEQLVRRNDELALSREKLSVASTALASGERAFGEKLEEARMLRIAVADARRSASVAEAGRRASGNLLGEVARLQNELTLERSKLQALAEEEARPANIHRWRRLEAADPDAFDALQKVAVLQRRLIRAMETSVAKGEEAARAEARVVELLSAAAEATPPAGLVEALATAQFACNERARALKAAQGELLMARARIADLKATVQGYETEAAAAVVLGKAADPRGGTTGGRSRSGSVGNAGAIAPPAAATHAIGKDGDIAPSQPTEADPASDSAAASESRRRSRGAAGSDAAAVHNIATTTTPRSTGSSSKHTRRKRAGTTTGVTTPHNSSSNSSGAQQDITLLAVVGLPASAPGPTAAVPSG